MESRAIAKYIRISPRKTRLVIDVIRGKKAEESVQILNAMNKKAAHIIAKVLNSAIANAKQKELKTEDMWIKTAEVNEGVRYKRFLARAMGRATQIIKPTSHIKIVLSDEPKGGMISKEVAAQKQVKKIKKAVPAVKHIKKIIPKKKEVKVKAGKTRRKSGSES